MQITHPGELAAFATAISWTISATLYEQVSKRTGTFVVNFVKVVIASALLALFMFATEGSAFPRTMPREAWFWLSLSGIFGFVIGDLFLFQAFIKVGARISMLVYAFSPALTAIAGFFLLDEVLGPLAIAGMAATLGGIVLVVLARPRADREARRNLFTGVAFAAIATVCQAAGYILSKQGMAYTTPVHATQVRLLVAILGFAVALLLARGGRDLRNALTDRFVMTRLSAASVFGPFVGVTLSMFAIRNADTGIASTIMALTPVLLLVPAVTVLKEKVTLREIAGALLACGGIALFFL